MLTELTTVKARLKIQPSDIEDDDLLTNFILSASGRFALECNRTFDRGAGLLFAFRADEMNLRPPVYPIESISGFELQTSAGEGFLAQAGIDYVIGPAGNIIELQVPLGTSRQLGRMTYSGGYVLPGFTADVGQTELPDEVEQSCVEQVAYWYANRARLGLTGVTAQGGSIQQLSTLDLLPNVWAVLKKYSRWIL